MRKMTLKLFEHQQKAVDQLKTGSILWGGVGSGKSLTALAYYFSKECGGIIESNGQVSDMKNPKDLYIITTAAKRDTLDWELECALFPISKERTASINGVKLTVDSWNNIGKYIKVENSFFIFDEQRVIGSGSWVKSFLKITKLNNWILLSATPGDTWMDYIPVFIANGFYKTRTEFLRTHVVFNTFTKYPKVDHYVEETKLNRFKNQIMVNMPYIKATKLHFENIIVGFDKEKYDQVAIKRWNPFKNAPIKDISEYCYTIRKVVNTHSSRVEWIMDILSKHRKIIVFYNFNYELELLHVLKGYIGTVVAEYNGHIHEPIPKSQSWIYLVQYMAGSEGWNCIETNTIVFYSQSYSYRIMTQAAGRIDRLNTPFTNLYYYTLRSESSIDLAIAKSLKNKRDFNEHSFSNS